MNHSTTTKRKTGGAETTVSEELNKVSTSAFALSAAAIACWSTIALFAGTMDAGGPFNLLGTLLNTITG